jgi:tetratricopeptide (TPR) repeat protein
MTCLVPLSLVALLSAPVPVPAGQAPRPLADAPADANALLSSAVALHQKGDIAGAVALYERVIALGADSPGLRSNLGAAYAGLGRYEDAVEQYGRALATDGGNVAVRRNLALAFYKAGRLAEAASETEKVLAAQPENEQATLLLADCRFRLGENARVIEILQPLAARASPERAVSYLLGMALLAEGRAAEAQAAIDRVLRDGSAEAHVFLAMMYAKDEDCAKAMPEIRQALDANPGVPLVNFLNGQCLMDEKRSDFEGAIAAFRAELAIDPNHFESNLFLGNLLREGGRAEEALGTLERAARLRPADVAAQFSLGAEYVALGRTEEALPLLERVAAAAPDHLQTQMQLAVVYHRLGRTADSARAREAVGRLQSEGESRFFSGVSDALARLLGKTSDLAAVAPPAKP